MLLQRLGNKVRQGQAWRRIHNEKIQAEALDTVEGIGHKLDVIFVYCVACSLRLLQEANNILQNDNRRKHVVICFSTLTCLVYPSALLSYLSFISSGAKTVRLLANTHGIMDTLAPRYRLQRVAGQVKILQSCPPSMTRHPSNP